MGLGLIECVELHETGVCKIPEESLNGGEIFPGLVTANLTCEHI